MHSVKLNYLSTAVNGGRNTLDWNRQNDIIAYAAGKRIVIYDSKEYRVIGTSVECHSSVVTSVSWVRSWDGTESGTLISTSYDGVAKIWLLSDINSEELEKGSIQICLHLLISLEGHKDSLTSCSALYIGCKVTEMVKVFAATMGEDHILKSWIVEVESGEYTEYSNYSLRGRSLAISSCIIPNLFNVNTYPLVALGGDDGKINIFAFVRNDSQLIGTLTGHQDWVTSLDCRLDGQDKLILASGSKDGAIRIWQICKESPQFTSDALRMKTISLKIQNGCHSDSGEDNYNQLFCTLQSVLLGHEGLISKVEWFSQGLNDSLKLLTCAQTEDRSLIIWKEDLDSQPEEDKEEMVSGSIWVESSRFGEVGGNREGFLNASFGPNGDSIVASSYQGGLHLWHLEDGLWDPKPAVNGHFKEVVDLCWGPDGSYLLTVSLDQTTRMHSMQKDRGKYSWRETSRPQVHGYDMSSICSLGRFKFASAGEEKVIRGFEAPLSVRKTFKRILGEETTTQDVINDDLPEVASVPSLGLSNKAVEDTGSCNGTSIDCRPPNESQLMLGTLWPEVAKLYGHGNDILSLAASNDGSLIASSCKATNPKDASILVFDSTDWKLKMSLEFHRLSVTQMAFSPGDSYILSGSRDRSWAVFKKEDEGFKLFSSSLNLSKSEQHSRVIWSVCWISDSSCKFITGSRDKSVVVWCPAFAEVEGSVSTKSIVGWNREATSLESEEVTAVDSFVLSEENILIAIGTSSGNISLRSYNHASKSFSSQQTKLSPSHQDSVKRLALKRNDRMELMLASCASDNATFIYQIDL